MQISQFHLLFTRRLLPLFVTQFLGALNDNLFKNALVILVAYRATTSATQTAIIVTIATAIFILPYFLFSATAGQLADKYGKAQLVRLVKLWEIGVMVLAAAGFAWSGIYYQLGVLLLLGIQATFFGPVKYGILPELLAEDELMGGNALIEAGTFLAILIGTIAGGLLILAAGGPAIVAATLLACSIAGYGASLFIPRQPAAAPALRLNPNIAGETWAVLRYANSGKPIRWSILGISWFWLVGAALLSQFPNYAKAVLGADNHVVTLFLTLNSIGIGIGSLICGRVLRGQASAKLVPFAALGLAWFAFDLYLAGGHPGTGLYDARAFLSLAAHWRIVFDLFALALCAGLFVVPLYVILQARSEEAHRSRIIAANNIWNALFIVIAGAGSALMLKLGATVLDIFLALAAANAILAAASWRLWRGG
jgi:acyl-[acyl-carrier-protein]-phospholipid O-acyltransferase / long-chain-fatty-acid--[acyl-carrier-protein] ligase